MKTMDIRQAANVRLSGRFDPAQPGFPMLWTGASAEMSVRASKLEVRIQCDYRIMEPYLSFEVDGLRAQTFVPLRGTHWYPVMLGMDAGKAHSVRITQETQASPNDPACCITLLALRTDGALLPLPVPKMKLEFIGDSLTSGEGLRGPQNFMEWVPMCFSATDNYARMVADALHAQYQVISQSGWGAMCGWNGNPRTNLPDVYDFICLPPAMASDDGKARGGEKPYAFDFDPDVVIVNLGSNDANALKNGPYTDPKTGEVSVFTQEDLPRFEDRCLAFLTHLHKKNPRARILWAYGVVGEELTAPIQAAVTRAKADGIEAQYLALPNMSSIRNGLGSREHPGVAAQKHMAKLMVQALKK